MTTSRYRYLAETETPPTTTPSIGRLVAVGLGLVIAVAATMTWAAQPLQDATQGAVSASVSADKSAFAPAWVWLDPLRYPCPEGQRRMYREFSPGIWRADCEEG